MSFVFDVILELKDICNLASDKDFLSMEMQRGRNIVFFGKRNTGKTSLLKSFLVPDFLKKNPNGFVIFADLMGLKSEKDFDRRFQAAFEEATNKLKSPSPFVKSIASSIRRIRPRMEFDPLTSVPSFSLGIESSQEALPYSTLLKEIAKFHKKNKALIILDEFQDVSTFKSLTGKLRNELQQLPYDLSVIVSGSKKHILTRMFADPKAPFASWGIPREISSLTVKDYLPYANNRLKDYKIQLSEEACKHLIHRMSGIPESMNIVCDKISRMSEKHIEVKHIEYAVQQVIVERSALFTERLSFFSEKEQRFLKALADIEIVKNPTGKEFLRRANLSSGGCLPILRRLEDNAIIYKEEFGYKMADPLLCEYLKVLWA